MKIIKTLLEPTKEEELFGINRKNNQQSLETELFYYCKQYPPLSKEEELWEFRKAKHKFDREKIVRSNLRLVYKLAKENSNSKVTTIDLIGAGILGLNRAIDKFDSSYENRFFTYAYKWVWVYILNALKEDNTVVKGASGASICNSPYLCDNNQLSPIISLSTASNCSPELEEILTELLGIVLADILIRNIINGESAKTIAKDLNLTMRQVYFRIHKAKDIIKEELGYHGLKKIINN